jgi:hypothetical protein
MSNLMAQLRHTDSNPLYSIRWKGTIMRYLLAIYGNDEDWTQHPQAELQPIMDEHESFTRDLQSAGVFVAAEALMPSATATTIRIENGAPLLTDGPYIESKEQIGGFYLIDADNLDEALSWARRLASFEEYPVVIWPTVDM